MLGVAFGSIALMKSYLTPPGISLTIRVSRTVLPQLEMERAFFR